MKAETKFSAGDRVLVNGLDGEQNVHAVVVVPVPSIVDGHFVLVPIPMYKFKVGKEWFNAWESELTKVAKKR